MKKIFFTVSIVIFFATNLVGQAAVDIPLLLTDGSYTIPMAVGLDLTATNCIDPQLGESNLPTSPPAGIFESRFDLNPYGCPNMSSYKDYRPPGDPPAFPFTGMVEHTLWWQTSSTGLPIEITYDIPSGVLMKITDQIGGIILNIGPFSGQGTTTIPGSYTAIFVRAFLKMYYYNIGGVPTPDPIFSMNPDYLDFGIVEINQTKTLPVSITNMGYEDSLYIFNAVSSDTSFTISPDIFPIIISPLCEQTFNITYSAVIGTHIDSILFTHNAEGSPTKLRLYATTYEPPPPPIECHAQMQNKILVSDGVEESWMRFGIDSSGTDGIDPQLGEFGPLPPFPAAGVFEVQFFLPENNFNGSLSSYCDYRGAYLPFIGQKEWRLAYQTAYGNEITISWNFPPYITGFLKDIINGTFINVPMIDSGSYTIQNPYVFDKLRMLIDFDIQTPIELNSFNVSLIDNNVLLKWKTATETNNSGFKVLRKAQNDNDWETIGFVSGFGSTTESKSYSFTDENVTTGTYKYRLKQIDFDGSFEYSNEIEVAVDFTPKEIVLYQNYPNPFNPKTVISYQLPVTGNVTLKVYDVLGNEVTILVNEEKQLGVYEVGFDGTDLPSGIYFYKLIAGSFVETKKMILIR